MRYPHIIKNRCGVYCFRLVVPVALQHRGAPREIRFSLQTKNPAIVAESFPFALLSAQSLLRDLHNLTMEHRGTVAELSEAMTVMIAAKRKEIRLRELLAQKDDEYWKELRARKQAEWALQDNQQQLKQVAHKAIEINGQLKQSQVQLEQLTTELASRTPAPAVTHSSIEPLSVLIIAFIDDCRVRLKLGKKTLAQRTSNLERFLDIVGDQPCNQLSADNIRFYREIIHTLPKNLTKQAVWKSRPAAPADKAKWYKELHQHGLENLSEQGQDSHFSDIRPFLEWLAKERKHSENFADMLSPIKDNADEKDTVLPLNDTEMGILVEKHFKPAAKLSRNEQPKDWHFWAPLIALTMGLRSDEIGRLTVNHINADFHGIAIMKVLGTKTANAVRTVPLPQNLIDAGFLDYVALMRTDAASVADGGRLFPDWKLGGKKEAPTYSHAMTKYFCRQKTTKDGKPHYSGLVVRLGLDREGRDFTFHGLRKTLINAAYHTGVPLEKLQAIVGHGTDLFKTYKLPKNHVSHSDATFSYISTDSAYAPNVKASLTDLKAQIDSVNFGYSLAGINWQAWRKSKNLRTK